ncbi:MAG: tRNA adenosine(34) deaminase TadA [Woeseiaceae bacterium]
MTSGWSELDLRFMRAALLKADEALSAGEVPVGAVIVIGGRIAGAAHNRSIGDCDPTAHAEVIALRQAAKSAGNYRIAGATAYVTLEPCPMCIGAMLHARIGRLVFGAYDPKAGAAGSVVDLCNDRRLNHRIEVNGGLLAAECSELLKGFFATRRS